MKFVQLGVVEYSMGYLDSEVCYTSRVTEEISPYSLKKEVIAMLESEGMKNVQGDYDSENVFYFSAEISGSHQNVKVTVIPALEIGDKFYKLEEVE